MLVTLTPAGNALRRVVDAVYMYVYIYIEREIELFRAE